MSFDEYETIPSSNVTDHMMAGAIAGIMEHCVMYPLDSVKVCAWLVVYIYLCVYGILRKCFVWEKIVSVSCVSMW